MATEWEESDSHARQSLHELEVRNECKRHNGMRSLSLGRSACRIDPLFYQLIPIARPVIIRPITRRGITIPEPDPLPGRRQNEPAVLGRGESQVRGKRRSHPPWQRNASCLRSQVTSTWCTFGHRPLTHRCVILTTNCQVPPAVVLCSSVRRTDSPSAFLTGSERAPVAHTGRQLRPGSKLLR